MTLQDWCLQYQEWKDICENVKLSSGQTKIGNYTPEWNDYTCDSASQWQNAGIFVRIIEECCKETDAKQADDILLIVTEGIPPEYFNVSRELYGRFFDLLSYKLKETRFE